MASKIIVCSSSGLLALSKVRTPDTPPRVFIRQALKTIKNKTKIKKTLATAGCASISPVALSLAHEIVASFGYFAGEVW